MIRPVCSGGCHTYRESKRVTLGREFDEFSCPTCGRHPDEADSPDPDLAEQE